MVTNCSDVHIESESFEVPFESDDALSNHVMCKYEEYELGDLDTSDSPSEEIEDDPVQIDSDETEYNSDKATLELKNFLRSWTIKHTVGNNAVSELLSHLNKYSCFYTLSKDVRTLLRTPRKCNIIDIEPGTYCHFGLIKMV